MRLVDFHMETALHSLMHGGHARKRPPERGTCAGCAKTRRLYRPPVEDVYIDSIEFVWRERGAEPWPHPAGYCHRCRFKARMFRRIVLHRTLREEREATAVAILRDPERYAHGETDDDR